MILDGITGLNIQGWVRKGNTFLYDNQWHNFVYTTSSAGNKMYLDGVLQTVSYASGSSSTNAVFNAYNVTKTNVAFLWGARKVSASIDIYTKSKSGHLSVWKRALTDAEVVANYNFQKISFGL